MKSKRPTAVLVMAILSFVFGGLGLVMVCCSGLSLGVISGLSKVQPPAAQPAAPNPFAVFEALNFPEYRTFMIADLGIGAVLGIVLIVCGFGLLKLRPWSRHLAIAWAVLKILTVTAGTIWSLAVLSPKMQEVMAKQNLPQGANIGANPMFGNLGAIFGAVFGVSLPIAMIIVMLLPSVSRAFAGHHDDAPEVEPEDYYDARSDDAPNRT